MADRIAPTKFQQAVLRFRTHCNILNAGGRGSGKSFSLILDLLGHCVDFGDSARPLVTRESHAGLLELQGAVYELCVAAFGPTVSRNKAENMIYLPTGGQITFTNIGDDTAYAKHQGKSCTAIYGDEVGNYPPQAFAFLRRLLSNLRVPPGRRPHVHWTANPHGRSHAVLMREFIQKSPPWHPFADAAGNLWIWTTSSLDDNPHIDRITYRRNLVAACGNDKNLADAWLRGDWSVLGGSMFCPPYDPATHIIKTPPYYDARFHVGADWGTAAPAVGLLIARLQSPFGPYRQGDYIVLDETHTAADPADLSVGNGAPPAMFGDMIEEMLARNGASKRTRVTMDDARGLTGDTVCGILREMGINARKPYRKDRTGTWNLIRQLLHNATTGEGQALWITDRCPYLLQTLPEAPRGTLRPEDVDPKWACDHALDALGYGLQTMQNARVTSGRVVGWPR